MERSIEACTRETFDLLVIGGGIHGAGVARDAASRGLRVCLLERGDFGQGTSSRSSGLIHGGLRYLAQGQFGVVRECLRERARLLRLAPHLVRPLPFLIPLYRPAPDGRRGWGRLALRVGLSIYDRLGGGRELPAHRMLGRDETLAIEPSLDAAGLRGAFAYQDATVDDRRLVIVNLIAAARAGAVCVNHAQVIDVQPGLLVHARDALSRDGFCVRARAVVNAAGPLADEVVRRIGISDPRRLRLTQGAHLVFPVRRQSHALLLRAPRDGRVFFVLPRGETTVIGTTESPFEGDPLQVMARDDEITYLLESAASYLPAAGLDRASLLYTFAGVRPLVARRHRPAGKLSREAAIEVTYIGGAPLITIFGGKLTAFRALAARVVDRLTDRPCRTVSEPLPGAFEGPPGAFERRAAAEARDRHALPDDVASHLAVRYGSEWPRVAAIGCQRPELLARLVPGRPEIAAEVVHAVREEMAVTLSDAVLGRLTLGRSPDRGRAGAELAADLMAAELGWDEHRRRAELAAYAEALSEARPSGQTGRACRSAPR